MPVDENARQLPAKAERAAARAAKKDAVVAAKAEFDALPATERWASFERIGMLLNQQQWIFAKTMPQNPHFYTLRRKWTSDQDFQWTVAQLRAHGYQKQFGKTWYTQLDVNDHFYWTMGWPVNYPNGMACTILINRKRGSGLGAAVPYDSIAARYDTLFRDEASLARNAEVFGLVGDMTGLDVLDVGCGTGRALDYAQHAAGYTGIDPSQAMLSRLLARYPNAHTICTALRSFVPLAANGEIGRYDVVLALFGTGSYLTDEELERIPMLLRPGGRAAIMFYDADHVSQTSVEGMAPHRPWALGLFRGEIEKIGHQILCLYVKPLIDSDPVGETARGLG
jgi:SAM-dependent methyltransferase